MLVSVGSDFSVDDADTDSKEFHRADVLEYTPKVSSSRFTPPAFETASAKLSVPSPASYGAPPTNVTISATTSSPTT